MTDRRWRFQLDGNKVDINDLLDLFSDREQFTHDTQGRLCLQLPLPLASEDSAGAFEAATQHLARLNGIASIFHENHGPVKIGGGAYTDPETGKEVPIIAGVEGIPSGLRMGTNGMIIQEGCSPTAFEPFGDHVLKLAYQNEDLERALYLYGGTSHDWRGLYMVLEAIEDGNGGERRLIQRGWAPDGAIKRLKDTANSFRAIGLQARHGSNTIGSNSPKQTLEEAKALIRNLLDCWIKDLRRRSAEGSSTLANGAGK